MITTAVEDDGVPMRPVDALDTTTGGGSAVSYAVPRAPRSRRFVVPAAALGLGLALGGGALALLAQF